MIYLKPCPMCGGSAEIFNESLYAGRDGLDTHGVRCKSCGLQIGEKNYIGAEVSQRQENTIIKWNSRLIFTFPIAKHFIGVHVEGDYIYYDEYPKELTQEVIKQIKLQPMYSKFELQQILEKHGIDSI